MLENGIRKEESSINFWPSFADVSLITVLILILLIFIQLVANTEAFKLQKIRQKQATIEQLVKEAVGKRGLNDIAFSSLFEVQYITFSDRVLFKQGKADLQQSGIEILRAVGMVLKNNQHFYESIQIAGHTDKVPIRTGQFSANWELSSARATAVVKYFDVELEMDPEMIPMSAVGLSKYRPVDPADTPVAYSKNRRIEMALYYNAD